MLSVVACLPVLPSSSVPFPSPPSSPTCPPPCLLPLFLLPVLFFFSELGQNLAHFSWYFGYWFIEALYLLRIIAFILNAESIPGTGRSKGKSCLSRRQERGRGSDVGMTTLAWEVS